MRVKPVSVLLFFLILFSALTLAFLSVSNEVVPNFYTIAIDYMEKDLGWGRVAREPAEVLSTSNSFTSNSEAVFAKLNKPIRYNPKALRFNDKTIQIENIQLTAKDVLEAPTVWENAGWYQKSAKVGEEGNIIIDGHYDTNTGAPAAFWGLKNLKVNDKVVLIDTSDKEFSYNVEEIFYVDIRDPERTFVFDEVTGKSELTLITCGGVWDSSKGTYDKRLVVKAFLVSN